MSTATTILYCIAGVLGVWSSSILWRFWTLRRIHRHAGSTPAKAEIVAAVSASQRRVVARIALLCIFAALAILAGAEALRVSAGGASSLALIHAGTGILVVLACGAAFAAWRFDPAHGRRRCPRCWYDLLGTPGRRCPECGHEPKTERALLKTRRRLRLFGAAAALLCGAYAVHTVPLATRYGIRAAIPTTGLIVALPWLPDEFLSKGPACLKERMKYGDLAPWQTSLLIRRCRFIIENSGDPSDILVAVDHFPAWATLPTLGRRGQRRIIEDACKGELPVGLPHWRVFHLLPTLDDRMSQELMPLVLDTIESGDGPRVALAISIAMRMGSIAEAGGAAAVLPHPLPPGCEALPLVKQIVQTRPLAGAISLRGLASMCHDPAVVEMIATLLRSDDPLVREHAARAAEYLQSDGAPLAAALELMAADPRESSTGKIVAAHSLAMIRNAPVTAPNAGR